VGRSCECQQKARPGDHAPTEPSHGAEIGMPCHCGGVIRASGAARCVLSGDLRGHSGFRFAGSRLVISAGGNFGRPPDKPSTAGDTSEVSVGCPVGSQKDLGGVPSGHRRGVLGVGAPVFLGFARGFTHRGVEVCHLCHPVSTVPPGDFGTEGSSVIAHGLDAKRFFF